jgi:ABC-2 type transport system ATP-binding protein
MTAARSDPHPNSSADGVRIRSLSVRLGGRDVLRDVELTLGAQVVALVGPNGAGKTVLLRVLATLIPSFRGEVLVAGSRLATRKGAAAARQDLGYLPQEPRFPDDFTVFEAVEYAAWLKKVPQKRRRRVVAETIDELDLGGVAAKKLRVLSGGTRRRAHIGQALVHRPSVLLLDEPTTGLDPAHRVDLRRLLGDIASDRLLVLSTHLTEDIEMLADRVIVLQDGQVGFDGTPRQLADLGERDLSTQYAGAIEQGLRLIGGPR